MICSFARLQQRASASGPKRQLQLAPGAYVPPAVFVAVCLLLLGAHTGLTDELSSADVIVTGDSADVVIEKLGFQPDRVDETRLLGISYQQMTFRKAGSVITVRLIFDRVIATETQSTSTFWSLHD